MTDRLPGDSGPCRPRIDPRSATGSGGAQSTGASDAFPDDRWRGRCSRADARTLLAFDHHAVHIDDRWGVLLTLHLSHAAGNDADAALEFYVRFSHPRGHPAAPRDVQRLVRRLGIAPMAPPAPKSRDADVHREGRRMDRGGW